MARPNREDIDTFISITGSSEDVAIQRLQEHNGDLNQAVDAHFNEGDGNPVQGAPISAAENDPMDIDDPPEIVTRRLPSLFSDTTRLNPFSLLDPDFANSVFNRSRMFDRASDVRNRAPIVSHPREVREIPIEFKDGNSSSARPGHGPAIVDVTDTEQSHGPEIRGTVILEDDDTDSVSNSHSHDAGQTDQTYYSHPRPSAPVFDDAPYDGIDLEEEMLRAAIEASKKDAELQMHHDFSSDVRHVPGETGPNLHDDELSRAVSMSLKTAEQERALREQGILVGDFGPSASREFDVDGLGRVSDPIGRKEAGNSSTLDVVEELEEHPLIRHRSGRTSSASVNPQHASVPNKDFHPLSDTDHARADHPRTNGNAFPSDEWGGISSEEHDEAVMLEAAIFGRTSEEGGYNFSYAQPRPWHAPRPLSPGLVAQRSIREQQDDEYFASLKADRERETKALEEERSSKQAALVEERRMEEEARRKLEEEQELERLLAAKEATLPAEPSADDNNVVNLVVRMPDGSRRGRRFSKSDKLKYLYDFIDVGRAFKPGTYRLIRPFPRRPFSEEESSSTLSELGLTSKQEALYLEPI
ncbi:hypothetical protein V2J09_014687 [Rumex salicifolius]